MARVLMLTMTLLFGCTKSAAERKLSVEEFADLSEVKEELSRDAGPPCVSSVFGSEPQTAKFCEGLRATRVRDMICRHVLKLPEDSHGWSAAEHTQLRRCLEDFVVSR